MIFKGNNAEKIATTLIIFIVLFSIFIFISLAFKSVTHSSVENMVKDGLGFSATCIAPIIAILLFSDWRAQHFQAKIEKDGLEIYDLILKINLKLFYLERHALKKEISLKKLEELYEINSEIFLLLKNLDMKILSFEHQKEFSSESNKKFTDKAKEIQRRQNFIKSSVRELLSGFEVLIGKSNFTQRHRNFTKIQNEDIYDNLDLLDEDITTLSVYITELKPYIK